MKTLKEFLSEADNAEGSWHWIWNRDGTKKIKVFVPNKNKSANEAASIYSGNSRVNLFGDVDSNVKSHLKHLQDSGHKITRNSEFGGQHWITSEKDGKEYHHTLSPHQSGTTIETQVTNKSVSEIYLPSNRTKHSSTGKSSGFNPNGGKKRRMSSEHIVTHDPSKNHFLVHMPGEEAEPEDTFKYHDAEDRAAVKAKAEKHALNLSYQ